MILEERELRQYFHDIYITFLGTNLKNSACVNPDELLQHAENHFTKEIAKLEALTKRFKENDK